MLKRTIFLAIAAWVVLAIGGAAQAGLIANGSFELPDVADGSDDVSDATGHTWSGGWTSADNAKTTGYGAGVKDPSVDLTGQTGSQYAEIWLPSSTTQNQWIKIYSPTLEAVQAGYTYTFDVSATWQKDWGGGSQPTWTTSITLRLSGNAFDTNLPAMTDKVFTEMQIVVVLDGSGDLVSHTAGSGPLVGTNLLGGNAEIQLMGGRALNTGGGGGSHVMFDNVRFLGVPEPVTLSLLAFGGVALLLRKRRR